MKEWIKLDATYTQSTDDSFLVKSNTIRRIGETKKSKLTITNTFQGATKSQRASAQLVQSWDEAVIELLQIQLENKNGCTFDTILQSDLPVVIKSRNCTVETRYSIAPEKALEAGTYELWAQVKVKYRD